jgi:hypothetical protein
VRVRGALLALLLVAAAAFTQQTSVPRDWGKYPPIVQLDTDADIFAIGDVHGDYDRLVKLLAAARIIEGATEDPRKVTWTAGRAVLVFTGDLIDKGPHSLKVLQLASALRETAAKNGGQVITLMGNHEAEFLADPTEKKVKDFAQDLHAAGFLPKDVAACHGDLGQFLCSRPFGARVRDWFFSHGGNTGGRTIPQLIADFENGVNKDGFGSREVVDANSMLEARLGEEGPGRKSWFDIESPKHTEARLLARYAHALGVAHLVQGHQHQAFVFEDGQKRKTGQMFQWHGLLFLIDVGMSEGVGDSRGAVLHIQHRNGEEAVAIYPDGTDISLWKK